MIVTGVIFSIFLCTSNNHDIEILINYLIDGRYLILIGICLLVIVAGLAMGGRPWRCVLVLFVSSVLKITALVGNFTFTKVMMPFIWPNMLVSHSKVWDATTTYVRQSAMAGEPVEI